MKKLSWKLANLYFMAERSEGDEAWFCCAVCGSKKLKDISRRPSGSISYTCAKKSCGSQIQIEIAESSDGQLSIYSMWTQ